MSTMYFFLTVKQIHHFKTRDSYFESNELCAYCGVYIILGKLKTYANKSHLLLLPLLLLLLALLLILLLLVGTQQLSATCDRFVLY